MEQEQRELARMEAELARKKKLLEEVDEFAENEEEEVRTCPGYFLLSPFYIVGSCRIGSNLSAATGSADVPTVGGRQTLPTEARCHPHEQLPALR